MKWQIGEFETSVEMKYGKENPNYELEKSILEDFKKLERRMDIQSKLEK